MTDMITITCGDLAALGGPWDDLLRHDPDHQVPDDPHCWCWREPQPEDWTGGKTSPPDLPAELLEQRCHGMETIKVGAYHLARRAREAVRRLEVDAKCESWKLVALDRALLQKGLEAYDAAFPELAMNAQEVD